MNFKLNNLQAENISKSFGDLILFENISLSIDNEQKIALIGRNGSGKTSLLNILGGKDTPDKGRIAFRNGLSVSYLEQFPLMDDNKTIIEQVFDSSDEISSAVRDYESALLIYDKHTLDLASRKMDSLNAWEFETRAKQILSKLKINNPDQKIGQLSGGQKKRIALANALINKSDILILDEPTNHLDMDMIEWLESYLIKLKCSVLMVTHDRYFLNRISNSIIELDNRKLYEYQGNYESFLEKREERLNNQSSGIEKARSILKKELEWMRRMPLARGTKAKARMDAFYDLKEYASQKVPDRKIDLKVRPQRLG